MAERVGGKERTHLVEVDLDAADVGRADGNHAEEAVSPATEECDTFVQNEQVLQTFGHVRRDREEFT